LPATVALQETIAIPEPVTLVGEMAPQVRPEGIVSLKLTVPANPFNALTAIVEAAEDPAFTSGGEVAPIAKSWNTNVTVAVWTS